jgi:tRNA threonylcarbamoyladenosine biosynthesis protein TsaB
LRILAIDTALGACAACVTAQGAAEPLAQEAIAMERGHAEALLPLVDRVMAKVEGGFKSLDRVAVTVGPGSYTGLRVGIAAARAIGLAVRVPVVGVTTLSALLAALVAIDNRRLLAAAIDARHGHVYFQAVAPGGRSIIAPSLMSVRDAARVIGAGPATLTGSGAPALMAELAGFDVMVQDTPPAPDIAFVARLGLAADPAQALPKPLYLRGPDAQPQDAARLPRAKPAP